MSDGRAREASRLTVAFALVFSLLAVTAMPVAASHGPVIVSEHDTASDFNAGALTNTTVVGSGESATVEGDTVNVTFDFTGSEQTWVVPEGVDSIHVELHGAGTSSANGGYVEGELDVTPGETLRINVGEGRSGEQSGGFNGGGDGGSTTDSTGEGGAGATDIRQGGSTLSDRIAVAGGAGGSGDADASDSGAGDGGAGGADTGEDGQGNQAGGQSASGGGGGTQSAGGSGAGGGSDGSSGQGGNGESEAPSDFEEASGGGGGGGFFGGGGGEAEAANNDAAAGGGGGGSNYDDDLSSVDANQRGGGNSGDGQVVITYHAVETDSTYISQNHTVEGSVGGEVNFTELNNGTATVTWEGWDGSSWTQLNQTTGITTPGVKSASWSEFTTTDTVRVNVTVVNDTGSEPSVFEIESEGVEADTSAPTVDNSSATPTGQLTQTSVTFEIDVNDSDFGAAHGDSATAELFVDDSSVGTDTLTSNGTATVSHSLTTGGQRDYHWNVTDSYGHSQESQSFSITVPDTLQVRNETNESQLITGKSIEATFYATDGIPIAEQTSNDGNISLTGLPVGEPFVVVVNVTDYHQRTIYIDDIFEQADIFMLNQSITDAQTVIEVNDNTGNFPLDESIIKVQRALNRSEFTPDQEDIRWITITGETLGSDGSHTTHLEKFTRYRVIVENQEGDQNVLGEFVAEFDSTRLFQIGSRTFDFTQQEAGVQYGAEYTTISGTEHVRFSLNDSESGTTDVLVVIHERGNASNEIYNATSDGPFGDLSIAQPLDSDEEELEWVVDFEADQEDTDGKIGSVFAVGQQQRPLNIGDQNVETMASVLMLLLTFFMTSAGLNRYAGAVITPMMGAVLWYLGFMPAGVGAGAIIFALFIGGAYFASSSQAGGF